jgi:hypothetical protein
MSEYYIAIMEGGRFKGFVSSKNFLYVTRKAKQYGKPLGQVFKK